MGHLDVALDKGGGVAHEFLGDEVAPLVKPVAGDEFLGAGELCAPRRNGCPVHCTPPSEMR